jgi:hypothetical protein
VFENWVLRKIFGPNRDEVTGECRSDEEDILYRPILLCFLTCIIEIIHVTKGHKYSPWRSHVGSPVVDKEMNMWSSTM